MVHSATSHRPDALALLARLKAMAGEQRPNSEKPQATMADLVLKVPSAFPHLLILSPCPILFVSFCRLSVL